MTDQTNERLKSLLFSLDKTLGQKLDEIERLKALLEAVSKERDLYKSQYECANNQIGSWMRTVDSLHRKYQPGLFEEEDHA